MAEWRWSRNGFRQRVRRTQKIVPFADRLDSGASGQVVRIASLMKGLPSFSPWTLTLEAKPGRLEALAFGPDGQGGLAMRGPWLLPEDAGEAEVLDLAERIRAELAPKK